MAVDIRGFVGGEVRTGGLVRNGRVKEWTVPAVPVGPTTRPTGSQYVMAESLPRWSEFAPTSTRDGDLRGFIAAYAGAGKVLNVPEGKYSGPNWNTQNAASAADVENGWRGLVGAGQGTVFGYPASGFVKGTPPTSGTNPMHTIQVGVSSRKALEVGNFSMVGNAGHLHGGIRISADLNAASETLRVWNIWGDNAAPGNSNSPPGETFFINVWRSVRSLMEDITVEGRNNSSSAVGYNNANNTVTKRVYSNECRYGMPTWWKCTNIYTEDITSLGGYCGINMENVGGDIIHWRTTMKPNRTVRPSSMHSTYQSNQAAFKAKKVEFHDPVMDTGLKAGCFMLLSSKNYTVPGGDNGSTIQLQDPSLVHVFKRRADGSEYELTMQDTSIAGNASPDVTKYWYLYR